MTRLAEESLTTLVTRALMNANTSEANARSVAAALVAADMDGLASHGVSRLPSYADQAASGKVDGHARPQIESPAAAALCVDARCGFAYPAIGIGLDAALARVKETGVVALAVRNSHHFGVAGHHVEHVAQRGVVALAFGNSPAGIAPWGGSKAVFGTNPIAFATPRQRQAPLVVDLSMSKVARGKVMVARDRNQTVPDDWALDAAGHPTTDPAAVLDGGTMLPMGDAKGAALTLVVEILAAGLTGSHFGFEASSFFTANGEPPRVGQLFILIDPIKFGGEAYPHRLEQLMEAIVSQPGTRLPGERRLTARARHRAEGIEVPDELLADIRRRANISV
ncbi:sulfolactate dehydrogenase [Acidihalobacter yilgarnensis]|uniref:Sulfolactate dehydrogenase n=1 Tax=Acidihalobacter yilgarnensis TaxID=2819280 RepID=A0A1D8INJ0_9GAMM|nr:Ldh family oxidoreductase [Acidihalobacter yilgarnensis]AOU98033.1 sulfolactate dehydrogenase [Acidihalobacter yilgarnensis]